MTQRFTIDGDERLELHLSRICQKVTDDVQRITGDRLEALWLGGGYGRGEGGVLKSSRGHLPYNDLEFYVCTRGPLLANRRRYSWSLHQLGERLSPEAGIDVEFKLTSQQQLRRERHTMFVYDLVEGHRVLAGAKTISNCNVSSRAIPLYEATRLLMNRCSGLLFSEEKLQHREFTAADADFVGRNHAIAQLAFGVVVLTAHGQYHWSCRERAARLQHLVSDAPCLSQIRCHHSLGVEFKFHPQRRNGDASSFRPMHQELLNIGRELWLWLESRRLETEFTSPRDYATSPVNKCPETTAWRNGLIQLVRFKAAATNGGKLLRYPRERLLEALPLLLWSGLNADDRDRLQTLLMTSTSSLSGFVDAYTKIWQRFN